MKKIILFLLYCFLSTSLNFALVIDQENLLDGPEEKQKLHAIYAVQNVAQNNNHQAAYNLLNDKYEITHVNDTKPFTESKTPLHWVFSKGFLVKIGENPTDPNRYKIRQRKVAGAVKALLGWGADVNAQDYKGNSALHYAMKQENLNAVNFLLKAGANPNLQNNSGDTPLMLVIKKVRNRQENTKHDPFLERNPGIYEVVAKFFEFYPDISIINFNDESVLSVVESSKQKKSKPVRGTLRALIDDYIQKQKGKKKLTP